MDGAIAIVVIPHRAIKKEITEDAIKGFHLGGRGFCRLCGDCHSIGNSDRAGPDKAAVRFHHACVTCLNRAKLRVVTHLGDRAPSTVEHIDQEFVRLGFLNDAINLNIDHSFFLSTIRTKSVLSRIRPSRSNLTGPSRQLRYLQVLPCASRQPRSPLQHCVPPHLNSRKMPLRSQAWRCFLAPLPLESTENLCS